MYLHIRCSAGSFGVLNRPKRRRGNLSSFTLVEVVIAIGVTAFVLVSILGLMAYASQTVQQSDKYARLASVVSQVLTTLGSQSFAMSPYLLGENNSSGNFNPLSSTNYYTSEGLPTNSAGGYYQCVVSDATPANFALTNADGNYFLEPVQVTIRWPYPKPNNTNIIVTSLLNYE